MATYKVIQDIEAEDKFVGPLTLKQFVFAMGGTLFGYLSFIALAKGLAWGILFTGPPCLFGFFMAVPWSREQPTDVWVLAKIRFRLKSRKRVWDQEGLQELVKITAPKKIEKPLTNNLSQTEVKSRLKVLAATIDSRGWSIKSAPVMNPLEASDNDRLINLDSLPSENAKEDEAVPDMMEQKHDNLDNMIEKSDHDRRVQLYEKMDQMRSGAPLEAQSQPAPVVEPPLPAPTPTPAATETNEAALIAKLKASHDAGDMAQGHLHRIPTTSQPAPVAAPQVSQDDTTYAATDTAADEATEVEKAQAPMTEQPVPDILDLARNNDLNVATIARQASSKDTGYNPNEVVISLH